MVENGSRTRPPAVETVGAVVSNGRDGRPRTDAELAKVERAVLEQRWGTDFIDGQDQEAKAAARKAWVELMNA